MSLFSKRLVAALALVAAGTFATRLALAGEEVAKPAAPDAKAAPADAPKTVETPATKTPSPFHSVMGFLAKQIAPDLDCPCPSKAEGEKAWRGWFAGGADVPMAALRDRLVADGWTADRFVGFFQKMAKSGCDKGDCAKGDCAKGDCKDCAKGGCKECAKGDSKGAKDAASADDKDDDSAKDDDSSAQSKKPSSAAPAKSAEPTKP